MALRSISRKLAREVEKLHFGPPVATVYNPILYARGAHEEYLQRYGRAPKDVLLVGMNPGPWGMVQTGIPFGDVTLTAQWLGITSGVGAPSEQHPKRPILGFDCTRHEVSGTRLWSWARDRYVTPAAFFSRFFVWNYCPLAFLEAGGRNRTPDRLPASERHPLFTACDQALRRVVKALDPRHVVGIGAFAEGRIRAALQPTQRLVGRVLHPSPASPRANRGWAREVEEELGALGIEIP